MPRFSFPLRAEMLVVIASLLLAACASTPLEEAPAGTSSPTPASGAAATNRQSQSAVAPVVAGNALPDTAGPAGTGRIVYFDYDSATIRSEFVPVIEAHARYLSTHHQRRLKIAGHTDERGGREYNLALGQQRAEAVRRSMQLLGAGAGQIETISFGEEKPVEAAHAEPAWAHNRRAELSYQ